MSTEVPKILLKRSLKSVSLPSVFGASRHHLFVPCLLLGASPGTFIDLILRTVSVPPSQWAQWQPTAAPLLWRGSYLGTRGEALLERLLPPRAEEPAWEARPLEPGPDLTVVGGT